MNRTTALSLISLTSVLLALGCYPAHVPPGPNAPAATIKLRTIHTYTPTHDLQHLALVDERRVEREPARLGESAAWTRVAPGWRTFELASSFVRRVSVSQQVAVYSTYRCGNSTCSRTTYQTQYVMQTQTVDHCKRAGQVHTRHGLTYLLSFNYFGPRSCSLLCHEQRFDASGQFQLVPCQAYRPVD